MNRRGGEEEEEAAERGGRQNGICMQTSIDSYRTSTLFPSNSINPFSQGRDPPSSTHLPLDYHSGRSPSVKG